jgi:hypothetical protein
VIYVGLGALILFAVAFSSYERKAWGSGKTPFAFTAYPLILMLAVTVFVAPAAGFVTIPVGVVLVDGLFLSLIAAVSVAFRSIAASNASIARPLETFGPASSNKWPARVSAIEYIGLALLLGGLFLPSLVGGGPQTVEKGELGVGGIGGHVIELGIAYMLVALCQKDAQVVVRVAFVALVSWLLAVNQVKYLILLPFAAALLYRWLSRQLSTWKLAVLVVAVPLAIVVVIYTYFDVAAAASGLALTPALVAELAKHMVAYLVSGTIGLGQLLRAGQLSALGSEGLEYALAPVVNLVRFVTGVGNYFDVINPTYLVIHRDGVLDTNVFTLYGSLLFRAGWIGASAITLCYGASCYWIWCRWRARRGVIDGAAGAWWMAPLLFAWHDPFFIHLSIIEIMAFLWIRARLSRGVRLSRPQAGRGVAVASPQGGAGS